MPNIDAEMDFKDKNTKLTLPEKVGGGNTFSFVEVGVKKAYTI